MDIAPGCVEVYVELTRDTYHVTDLQIGLAGAPTPGDFAFGFRDHRDGVPVLLNRHFMVGEQCFGLSFCASFDFSQELQMNLVAGVGCHLNRAAVCLDDKLPARSHGKCFVQISLDFCGGKRRGQ
jgi:hypothetical protein